MCLDYILYPPTTLRSSPLSYIAKFISFSPVKYLLPMIQEYMAVDPLSGFLRNLHADAHSECSSSPHMTPSSVVNIFKVDPTHYFCGKVENQCTFNYHFLLS